MLTSSRLLLRALAGVALLGGLATVPAVLPSSEASAPARTGAKIDTDECGAVILKPDNNRWSCSFVDQFTGTELDADKWIVQDTRQSGFRMGKTCFTPSSDNISVEGGDLRLVARKVRSFDCAASNGRFRTRYTGGMVGTRSRFAQTYGRFEIRAKFPATVVAGLHGGFWMHPNDLVYGPWPASGEIDIAEWWSVDATLVLPTLHYVGRDPSADSGWDCRVDDPGSYHTYTLEWARATMRVAIDGAWCFQRSWTPDYPQVAPQPFDHPFSMILNMGVGPAAGSNKVSWRTTFPSALVVDYAKAWR
ncbi:glycoside hydrolase family 16 protein [Nocardioides humilatus]|uniref:Glycoside hydrolase family 16 protein n=1 Tax=Nocardioides humilatus TaxID=2607660 RepID=A0A5B1LLW9_9ACTN|nr:glycoside hydrolase family 16 protein [Nocardioides humilatus]KAA1420800.1 glycoside hydrolase family 16 protein [Nocardioides humilatus]